MTVVTSVARFPLMGPGSAAQAKEASIPARARRPAQGSATTLDGMANDSVETWAETSNRLRATRLIQAHASADLLDAAATRWESVLRVHTSMTDLVFTRPEDRYP